jgi:hypothetical protein
MTKVVNNIFCTSFVIPTYVYILEELKCRQKGAWELM